MDKKYLIIFFIILLLLAVFTVQLARNTDLKDTTLNFCQQDSECIPDSCCHATSCVQENSAPSCPGVYCTLDCQNGTLDCGQKKCACVNNHCKAI